MISSKLLLLIAGKKNCSSVFNKKYFSVNCGSLKKEKFTTN